MRFEAFGGVNIAEERFDGFRFGEEERDGICFTFEFLA
jgi:hypothetical protein